MLSTNGEIRISVHHFMTGMSAQLAKAIYEMPAPSIMVVWKDTKGGNFSGSCMWRHRISIYMRMANSPKGTPDALDYEHIWWIICNDIPNGSPVNLRYLNFLPNLEIMDSPEPAQKVDADGVDMLYGEFVFPEIGDTPTEFAPAE